MESSYNYIASQAKHFYGMDEISLLLINMFGNKERGKTKPILLHGSPGIGKTQSVEFLSELLDKQLHGSVASQDDSVFTYAGMPIIIGKATKFTETKLVQALENGGIYYLDEIDQLPNPLQKAFSSLFDYRQEINRIDEEGMEVTLKAKKPLVIIGSYNDPKYGMDQAFEQSFLSRFVEIPFKEPPIGLATFVNSRETYRGDDLEDFTKEAQEFLNKRKLGYVEKRAAVIRKRDDDSVDVYVCKVEGDGYKTLKGEELEILENDNVIKYDAFIEPSLLDLSGDVKNLKDEFPENGFELNYKFLQFLEKVEERAKDEMNGFKTCDISPFRDPQSTVRQYQQFRNSLSKYQALFLTTELLIDNIAKGSYRTQPVNGSNVEDLLKNVAIEYGLLPSAVKGIEGKIVG